jgi:hypothetical protein
MASNARLLRLAVSIMVVLALPLVLAGMQIVFANQTLIRQEPVELNVGDSLVVHSDRFGLQQVFVEGNLSAATLVKPSQYPASDFEISASAPGTYQLTLIFNQSTDYKVNLLVKDGATNTVYNSTTYYISGGSFELDITAYFNARPQDAAIVASSVSPWDSFLGWMGNFGQAFPLWVKALYLLLGVQFLAVGGLWIRRETARKQETAQRLDLGDKVYLWLDVLYKFLVASFVSIVVIMGGELILLFVLKFMFLVSLNLLSLWDLFVIGFAAGIVIIVYLIRFTLASLFDLKPVESE